MKSLSIALATLGPVGYLPASGTIASILTAPLVYHFFSIHPDVSTQCAISASLIGIALWVIRIALDSFQRWDDPKEIVLDEVVGMFITYLAIPLTPLSLAIGLVLFRLFDIIKPFGIKRLEYVGGSLGIVLDDIVAGAMACASLHLVFWLLV
jgi:phosphatidylglycerophosphatase A